MINRETFIAFANHYNSQHKRAVQSTVFKWSGGHFVKLQSLQTYGARRCEVSSTSTVTCSSLLPTNILEAKTTSIRSFTNGMAMQVCLVPIHSYSGGHRIVSICDRKRSHRTLVWLITMETVRNTILSQLCTRPLEQGSSSTKRFPHMERMV